MSAAKPRRNLNMKMAKKMDSSSQHSSMDAGHDHSVAQPDPTVVDKSKAPASNTKTATPAKEGADSGKHSGHSPAQKAR